MAGKNNSGDRLRKMLSAQEQEQMVAAAQMQLGISRTMGACGSAVAFLGGRSSWQPEHRLGAVVYAMRLVVHNGADFKSAMGLDARDPASVPMAAIHDHVVETCRGAVESLGEPGASMAPVCVALGKCLLDAAFGLGADVKPDPSGALHVLHAVAESNVAALSPDGAAALAAKLGDAGPRFVASAAVALPAFEKLRDAIDAGRVSMGAVVQRAMPQVQLVR